MNVITVLKTVFAYSLYITAFTLLLPLLVLRLFWRARLSPAYKERILERFGIASIKPAPGGLWVHAVSVGEVIAAEPVIRSLREAYTDRSIILTTTTPTGSDRVSSLFGDAVHHVYAPYDWPPFVWLFMRRVRPAMIVIMETELWPVTIGLCHLMNIPVLIANARLSEKSSNGYKKLRWLVEPVLQPLWVAAQHKNDGDRFLALGVDDTRLTVTGSLKFDVELSKESREKALALRAEIGIGFDSADSLRFVWIAASTHRGEDEQLLEAHRKVLEHNPHALLVIVPRHPERFDEVADLIASCNMRFYRRSEGLAFVRGAQVVLVDTMGELMMLYGVADIAFVGGSLVPMGGHNFIEPAMWGLPVLSGPHRHNFLDIGKQLEAAGVLSTVHNSSDVAMSVVEAINNPRAVREAGNAGVKLINNNRGATKQLLAVIDRLLAFTD